MLILYVAASCLLAFAQATTAPAGAPPASTAAAKPADVPTPQDAKERMELAEKVNGLAGLNAPWHLKATYEVLALGKTPGEKGTFEEWHGTGQQYRVALHSPSLPVEEYENEQGVFRVGAQGWPLLPVSAIREMVDKPVDPEKDSEKIVLQNFERKFGPEKSQCTAGDAEKVQRTT